MNDKPRGPLPARYPASEPGGPEDWPDDIGEMAAGGPSRAGARRVIRRPNDDAPRRGFVRSVNPVPFLIAGIGLLLLLIVGVLVMAFNGWFDGQPATVVAAQYQPAAPPAGAARQQTASAAPAADQPGGAPAASPGGYQAGHLWRLGVHMRQAARRIGRALRGFPAAIRCQDQSASVPLAHRRGRQGRAYRRVADAIRYFRQSWHRALCRHGKADRDPVRGVLAGWLSCRRQSGTRRRGELL